MSKKTICILKERKTPVDNRSPLSPHQAYTFNKMQSEFEVVVESSATRCFSDKEFSSVGIKVIDDITGCDIFLGIKEVPVDALIANKTYFFFSHTAKYQAYNKNLLLKLLEARIKMIDYEYLVDEKGKRLIGFGKFAGIVGTHYAILMTGRKFNYFNIEPAYNFNSIDALYTTYQTLKLKSERFLITGNGNVARGALEVMKAAGIKQVTINEYLTKSYNRPVFVQARIWDLYRRKDWEPFDSQHFFSNPKSYCNNALPLIKNTDVIINSMYWNSNAPRLFEMSDINTEFRPKIISDITCDVNGSIPLTREQTDSDNPWYSYNIESESYNKAFVNKNNIEIQSVGNLPNELAHEASSNFGKVLLNDILPELNNNSEMLNRATITQAGELTPTFAYLEDWINRN